VAEGRRFHGKKTPGIFLANLITTVVIMASAPNARGESTMAPKEPSIEEYATVEAYVNQVPVYAFGYTYVYGLGPDLLPGTAMQEGNSYPIAKIQPKKSWEIESNYCGSTPAREPKTMWNDDQPLLPIHLIDGNPETAWSSRGMLSPDVQPEWIRIDLPSESTIASVVLVCSQKGPGSKPEHRLGKSLPRHLVVKLSQNGKDWETVYENKSFDGDESGPNAIRFEPRRAKMIWAIGKNFEEKNVGFWGPSFSIGEIEVLDPEGHNLALVSRGAGVQVSSTHYGYGMDRFTQDMLWPIQYDLGFKWTRVGYDMGTFLWSYVEREKGKLEIDRRSDEAVTEAHANGLSVILCLDKGNWLYHDPPRKTDWKKARVTEIMETYYDHQGWPHQSEDLMEGYLRYVDYMVRHFKGRVAYFEICNEWQGIGVGNYVKIVSEAIETIGKADPEAKIMLGSTGGFDKASILRCLGGVSLSGIKEGKLQLFGPTLALAKGLSAKDVTLNVDACSESEAGFVIRAKDRDNYLLANYSPFQGGIYFHEVVDGEWGGIHDLVRVEGLGPEIHLMASVDGPEVTFTLTGGEKEFVSTHPIGKYNEPGGFGLFHNRSEKQAFDCFTATDPTGKTLFEDRFDAPDGAAENWDRGEESFASNKGLARELDAVGWHPFYQEDPGSERYRSYRKDVAQFKKDCEALGFKGAYIASEWTWAAPYPGAPDWCTEMKKAKYTAQLMTLHSAMDVVSLYNETFQTGRINWDVTLLRNSSFQVDPITPAQPQPIYYVLRNLSTVLDGFKGAYFEVRFTGEKQFECDTFAKGEEDLMFAGWVPGKTEDGIVEFETDVTLPGRRIGSAKVYDIMNGTEQELVVTQQGNEAVLKGMLIKDYPVFVRLSR